MSDPNEVTIEAWATLAFEAAHQDVVASGPELRHLYAVLRSLATSVAEATREQCADDIRKLESDEQRDPLPGVSRVMAYRDAIDAVRSNAGLPNLRPPR